MTMSALSRNCGRGTVPCRKDPLLALQGEAGYQADLLRGGVHFGLWRWQYRIHKVRLVIVSQGKVGYVYARDGEPLPELLDPLIDSGVDLAAHLLEPQTYRLRHVFLPKAAFRNPCCTAVLVARSCPTSSCGDNTPRTAGKRRRMA